MLALRHETEDWRELLLSEIDEAEREAGVSYEPESYDDVAAELRSDAIGWLDGEGVANRREHSQRVGANEIVQDGSAAEREAFDAAVEAAMPHAKRRIRETIGELQAD